MELVARVCDVFHINGRGFVLVFEFASQTGKLKVGDKIELKDPGGGFTSATIHGVCHLNRGKNRKPNLSNWGITLAAPVNEEEFARDTEIWVVARGPSRAKTD